MTMNMNMMMIIIMIMIITIITMKLIINTNAKEDAEDSVNSVRSRRGAFECGPPPGSRGAASPGAQRRPSLLLLLLSWLLIISPPKKKPPPTPPPYNLTSLEGYLMRGVIVAWVPTPYPPPNKMTPPLIIASKCPCPYANRISEAFRIEFVHTSMRLRSTTKPSIFSVGGGLTKIRFLWGG